MKGLEFFQANSSLGSQQFRIFILHYYMSHNSVSRIYSFFKKPIMNEIQSKSKIDKLIHGVIRGKYQNYKTFPCLFESSFS